MVMLFVIVAATALVYVTVPAGIASYLSLATLAGLDAVIGGVRAGLEDKFKSDIFISGFVVNTLLAVLLA